MTGRRNVRSSGGLSRAQFLQTAGIAGAALGAAVAGLGGIAKAQMPPPPDYMNASSYGPQYVFHTLAAVVDTVIPGVKDEPVDIVLFNGPQVIPLGTMYNLGALGTDTKGAAFLPQYGEMVLPPCYLYFYQLFPTMAGQPEIINMLIYMLDQFAAANAFKDLPYEAREQLFSLMDNTALLTQILIQQGIPPPQAFQQALQAKSLLTLIIYATQIIYYSELCNVVPSFNSAGQPIYQRNADNSWTRIPDGAWEQLDYPGPSYKEPDYASKYEGLKITIADGKVKFTR